MYLKITVNSSQVNNNTTSGGGVLSNTWLAIEVPNNNIVPTLWNGTAQIALMGYGTGKYWAKLGNITATGNHLEIRSNSFTVCGMDTFNVTVGQNCANYPTDPDAGYPVSGGTGNYTCNIKTIPLTLSTQKPSINVNTTLGVPPASYDFCAPVPYEISVNNAANGYVYALEADIRFPVGMTLNNTTGVLTYGGNTYAVASGLVSHYAATNTYTVDISGITSPISGTNSLPGVSAVASNQFELTFVTRFDCDYVSGSKIRTQFKGKSSCGDPIDPSQGKSEIKTKPVNVTQVPTDIQYDITVTSNDNKLRAYGQTELINVNIFNQKDSSMALPRGFRSTSPWERSEFPFLEILGEVKHKISVFALKGKMKSAKYLYGSASRIVDFKKFFIRGVATIGSIETIVATIDDAFNYVSGSFVAGINSPTGTPTVTVNAVTGERVITWTMPNGIAPGSSISFSFEVEVVAPGDVSCTNYDLNVSTRVQQSIDCSATGGVTCPGINSITSQQDEPLTVEKSTIAITSTTVNSTVNGANLDVAAGFSLENTSSIEIASGTIVSAYNDVNNNGAYDTGDVLLGTKTVISTIDASSTVDDVINFSVATSRGCNVILVVNTTNNNCICDIANTTIGCNSDLNLTKVASNANPNEGDNITFTLTVTNNGNSAPTNIVVKDIIPTGFTYNHPNHSTAPGTVTYTAGALEWNLGGFTLPVGDSISLTYTVAVDVCGEYKNQAEITKSSLNDPDSTPNNGN